MAQLTSWTSPPRSDAAADFRRVRGRGLRWSPDGARLAFDHRVNSDAGSSGSADISLIDVASGRVTSLVTLAGPDSNPRWSPDGRRLVFQSVMATPFYFFPNSVLAMVSVSGRRPESQSPGASTRTRSSSPGPDAGIFFAAAQRTWSSSTASTRRAGSRRTLRVRDDWIGQSFAVTPSGAHTAFVASGPREFPDIYAATVASTLTATKTQRSGRRLAGWPATVARWCAGRARTAPRSRACSTSRPTSRPGGAIPCWS